MSICADASKTSMILRSSQSIDSIGPEQRRTMAMRSGSKSWLQAQMRCALLINTAFLSRRKQLHALMKRVYYGNDRGGGE